MLSFIAYTVIILSIKLESLSRDKLLADIDTGPIVRIAPNEYSIDDPDAVKVIYGLGSQFIKVSTRSHNASNYLFRNLHSVFYAIYNTRFRAHGTSPAAPQILMLRLISSVIAIRSATQPHAAR
jgi:hypothetical protein